MDNLELRFLDGSITPCKIYLSAEIIKESEERIKIKPTEKTELIFKILKGFGIQSGALFQNNRIVFCGNIYLRDEENAIAMVDNPSFEVDIFYSSNIKLIEL